MSSSFKVQAFLILSSLLLHAALADIICEDLPKDACAFSISSSGNRCLLEKDVGGYHCRMSAVVVEWIKNHVETDECVATCGVDRETVGISSDALLERGFAAKLCSPACYGYCPNIIDLFSNLADGEGASLLDLCDAHRTNPHRSLFEILSSGDGAPAPNSDDPALSPSSM